MISEHDRSTGPAETGWRAARRAVVLVLLVAVPLVFDTTVWPVFTLPKFTVAALGASIGLVLTAAEWVARRPVAPWETGLSGPVALVVGWTTVSAATSSELSTSILGSRESLNGLVTFALFAVIFLTTANAFDTPRVKTALSVLWFGSGSAVLVYGALQLHDRWDPVPWVPFADLGAIWSTLGNPNDLAGFLAIILPVGLTLLALVRHPVARGLTVGMTVLLVAELVLASSRGAIVAAALAVVVVIACLRHRLASRVSLRPVLIASCAALLLGTGAFIAVGGEKVGAPGELLATGQGSTVALRVELWETAWRMGTENPLFGVGPDAFGRSFDAFRSDEFTDVYGPELVATDAHNLLLTRLAEQGVPGALALLALFGATLALLVRAGRELRRSRDTDDGYCLVVAVGAGLLAYIVQAMFNRQDIALDFCFWVLLGLACALGRSAQPRAAGSARLAGAHERDQGDEDGERAYA
ncbi:MAG: O-antigen ligase family protein [Actinomycetota bacterium]|nr:O-antigen ligase family protein [Actinomycetota bacterium]